MIEDKSRDQSRKKWKTTTKDRGHYPATLTIADAHRSCASNGMQERACCTTRPSPALAATCRKLMACIKVIPARARAAGAAAGSYTLRPDTLKKVLRQQWHAERYSGSGDPSPVPAVARWKVGKRGLVACTTCCDGCPHENN
eukprot:scaffold1115_cov21-Tisochrysis_lutea.AAC.1